MICRARPRYLQPEDVPQALRRNIRLPGPTEETPETAFYFNSGSLDFEYFLRCYNAFYNKKAKVAVQSFTCRTMLDAIVCSGSTAYIYDVKLEDAFLTFSEVEDVDVDIIVLTVYQGIPNREYIIFSAYCWEHGILLFEDLSHGTQSQRRKSSSGVRDFAQGITTGPAGCMNMRTNMKKAALCCVRRDIPIRTI